MNFRHDGDIGDIIFALPCLASFAKEHPVDLFLGINPYPNHPLALSKFSQKKAEYLMPLLAAQPYIQSVQLHNGEEIDVDLNLFRKYLDANCTHLAKLYLWCHEAYADLSQPWICLEESIPNDYILINRSKRYQNPNIDYFILKDYKCAFIGLEDEHQEFVEKFFNLPRIAVESALETAMLIHGCRCFVGNQSSAFSIAEGLKKSPRCLEIFLKATNVVTDSGYDFISQYGFQSIIKRIMA